MPPGLDITTAAPAPYDSDTTDVSHLVSGRELEAIIAAYSFKKPKKARRRILAAVRRVCKELGRKQGTKPTP